MMMTEEEKWCLHSEDSWCSIHRVSDEEKQELLDHLEELGSDEERRKYLGKCRVIKPHESGSNHVKQFMVEYYLKNFGEPSLKVCRKAFQKFYSKTSSVLNRENMSIFTEGIIIDRRRNNRPPTNQYGPPISEDDWRCLEEWIMQNVPRREAKKRWIIYDETSEKALRHVDLLNAYNNEAKFFGNRQFTMENWKKCWYVRLNLKNKWKFRTNKVPRS